MKKGPLTTYQLPVLGIYVEGEKFKELYEEDLKNKDESKLQELYETCGIENFPVGNWGDPNSISSMIIGYTMADSAHLEINLDDFKSYPESLKQEAEMKSKDINHYSLNVLREEMGALGITGEIKLHYPKVTFRPYD